MFQNSVEIVVKNKAGEIIHEFKKDNAICDDFLVNYGRIFMNDALNSFNGPYSSPVAFLLPDGPLWTGLPAFDRTNPYAPYVLTNNNVTNGSANELYAALTKSSPNNLTPPSTATQNRWKMFYSWSQLPLDLQLRAIGLTAMQTDQISNGYVGFGLYGNALPAVFVPETLIVLPSAFLVHGLSGATNIPDVLEISYFISVIGAS
jgi:hypothetical protein